MNGRLYANLFEIQNCVILKSKLLKDFDKVRREMLYFSIFLIFSAQVFAFDGTFDYARNKRQNFECGVSSLKSSTESLVAFGKKVGNEEWPWKAALFRLSQFICGGTIGNRRLV